MQEEINLLSEKLINQTQTHRDRINSFKEEWNKSQTDMEAELNLCGDHLFNERKNFQSIKENFETIERTLHKQLASKTVENENLRYQIQILHNEHNKTKSEAFRNQTEMTDNVNDLVSDKKALQNQLTLKISEIDRLKNQIDQLETDKSKIQSEWSRNQTELSNEIQDLINENAQLQNRIQQLEKKENITVSESVKSTAEIPSLVHYPTIENEKPRNQSLQLDCNKIGMQFFRNQTKMTEKIKGLRDRNHELHNKLETCQSNQNKICDGPIYDKNGLSLLKTQSEIEVCQDYGIYETPKDSILVFDDNARD